MQTKVILLEQIAKLGQLGDVVNVKAGYARNYLLPKGKALRANKANIAYFETQKQQLEARNLELKTDAEKVAKKFGKKIIVAIRQAGETGQLYGSVSGRDIAEMLEADGLKIEKNQVKLQNPIKAIGLHEISISLHPEVEVKLTINVARSKDEAKRQEKGEDLSKTNDDDEKTSKTKNNKNKKKSGKAKEIFEKKEDAEKFESDEKLEDEDENKDKDESKDEENNQSQQESDAQEQVKEAEKKEEPKEEVDENSKKDE